MVKITHLKKSAKSFRLPANESDRLRPKPSLNSESTKTPKSSTNTSSREQSRVLDKSHYSDTIYILWLPYERLFLIQNPNSTRAKDVQGSVLDQLGHAGIAYVLMQTPSPKYEGNVDAIMGNIRVGDRIISLGGDGTGSQVFNAVWGCLMICGVM